MRWYHKHKDVVKRYNELNREKIRRRRKIFYKKHRQKLIRLSEIWVQKHYQRKLIRERLHRRNTKKQVLGHYSPTLTCQRCGFSDIRALTIDHIKGDGARHRKRIGKLSGSEFYKWLIKNNFPSGFQVLCWNCQYIKREENDEVRHRGRI